MAKARLIASDINKDEFVGNLSFYGRCLWFGLCLVADDQGRILANHKVICSDIFPYDENVTSEKIAATIQEFLQAGKLVSYTDSKGRLLYQIVNWWNWQKGQEWPQPSRYEAPPGWTDRVRYRGSGRKILTLNWDKNPGFDDNSIPRPIPKAIPRAITELNLTEHNITESKGKRKKKERKTDSDSYPSSSVLIPLTPKEACSHPDIQAFQSVTGRIPGQKQYKLVIETIQFLQARFHGPEELVKYLQPFWLSWSSRKTRNNSRSYDPSNLAWLTEWAINDCIPPEYDPVQPARTKSDRNREILENWRKDGQT